MKPRLTGFLTRAVRRFLAGSEQEFVLRAPGEINLPPVEKCGLYIHIPFCKGGCPYCPYNKIKYNPALTGPYTAALLAEIESYRRRLGRLEISSVYIGGGTPTNLIKELGPILDAVRNCFKIKGPICIETNPADISADTVQRLLEYGIELVSVGVQSFDDSNLRFLGRNYDRSTLERSLDTVLTAPFRSVNLDLMFALPGQTLSGLEKDLALALGTGANQVTAYPLFSFPYTAAGEHLKLEFVRLPGFRVRRKMYRFIHGYCLQQGLERVSVWGFKRGSVLRYSSVTRDHYIGLGAGAASYLGNAFYINTFSVPEYIKSATGGRLPVAVQMDVSAALSRYYWLYWRLYDTSIPLGQAGIVFNGDRNFNLFLSLSHLAGLGKRKGELFRLTEKGTFWLHLAQNYFALDYINKIWTSAGREPWPEQIEF